MFSPFEITGRTRTHVVQMFKPRFAAHRVVAEAFMDMRSEAKRYGIDLIPFSSFRDFKTQLRTWNQKYSGRKPLYDMDGNIRNYPTLSEDEIIAHILNWSALPGGSRHHWGTDIDVVDVAAMPDGYTVKLLLGEVATDGIFYPLHCWLDENIERFGFFRPYRDYKGGMYPEPWQLSYAPVSTKAIKCITPDILRSAIEETDILGKEKILPLIPDIFENHILNIYGPNEQQV